MDPKPNEVADQQATNSSTSPLVNPENQTVVNQKPPHKLPVLKFILLGVLFIFGVALIIGAYFIGMNNSNKEHAFISPSPTTSNNLVSKMKTYTNKNFSFKYPSEWQITSPYPGGPTDETIGLEKSGDERLEGAAPPIKGTYYDNPNNLSLKEWEEQTQKTDQGLMGYYIPDAKITKTGDNIYYSSDKGTCDPLYCDQVIIINNKKIFIFQHLGLLKSDLSQDRNIYKETFEEIISTFKFTN